jgi:hypothetical protein
MIGNQMFSKGIPPPASATLVLSPVGVGVPTPFCMPDPRTPEFETTSTFNKEKLKMLKKTLLLLIASATLALTTGNAVPPVPVCPPVCGSGTLN